MKVLIVGSGGREHAIAWSVAKNPKVDKIYCAPGNAGISQYAECVPIGAMEFEKLADFAQENSVDLTVIGMDDPLVGGVGRFRGKRPESIRTQKERRDPGGVQGFFQGSDEKIRNSHSGI